MRTSLARHRTALRGALCRLDQNARARRQHLAKDLFISQSDPEKAEGGSRAAPECEKNIAPRCLTDSKAGLPIARDERVLKKFLSLPDRAECRRS